MSLRLRQTIPGQPTRAASSHHRIAAVVLQDKRFIAYTSSSNVVLLNHELELANTLPFWAALPYRTASTSKQSVDGVVFCKPAGLIIAWSGSHIVIWSRATLKGHTRWTVHSTLVVASAVSSVDYKAGQLVIGTADGVQLWHTEENAAVVVWDKIWKRSLPRPALVSFSPASGHIACYSEGERCVRILSVNRKLELLGVPQEIRQPREIIWIGWRRAYSASLGDAHLYIITTKSVLRVYAPVLDDPAWFQLHCTLDSRSFSHTGRHTSGKMKGKAPTHDAQGSIWPLDADIVRDTIVRHLAADDIEAEDVGDKRVLEAMLGEETDVIMFVGQDGSVVLRSIMNMDRKPPTLLRSVVLARILTSVDRLPPDTRPPVLFPLTQAPHILAISPGTNDDPSLQFRSLSIAELISSRAAGLSRTPQTMHDESTLVQLHSNIDHFVRTPNGRGLMAVTDSGEVGVWSKIQRGKPKRGVKQLKTLLGRGQWTRGIMPEESAIFAKGRAIVFYSRMPSGEGQITLQHLESEHQVPTEPYVLPDFDLPENSTIKMLLAVSDIDDGMSAVGRRTRMAYVMAASELGDAWVWRIRSKRFATTTNDGDDENDTTEGRDGRPVITLVSKTKLPIEQERRGSMPADSPVEPLPRLILPVDPMGWHQSIIDWKTDTPLQDMILTLSEGGVLEFWKPRLGKHSTSTTSGALGFTPNLIEDQPFAFTNPFAPRTTPATGGSRGILTDGWTKSGSVHTGRVNVRLARCSSRKKTVLVRDLENGEQEMTIWDSNVSEFSTGLELEKIYDKDELIQDLDWTTTSDLQSVLAVGFPHRVDLVCEQRMSYVDDTPGWAAFVTIDLTQYTSIPINDSIWLAGGSLAVGCGNQIYLFSRFLDRESPLPTPRSSAKNVQMDDEPEDIFQLIAHQNGPLWDYHPVLLAQCLLLDKIDLVKQILVALHRALTAGDDDGSRRLQYDRLDPAAFITRAKARRSSKILAPKYESLFDAMPTASALDDDEPKYNASLVSDLSTRLFDGNVYIPLTASERSLLATIAQAVIEVESQRRSLDICGLRYLISLRMYVTLTRRTGLSGMATPVSTHSGNKQKAHLSFRNIVWASHSESQDVMLAAAHQGCADGKMFWGDAKRLGVFLWLKSTEMVSMRRLILQKAQLEIVARNRFMADENRDPTLCSLIFFALGKKKIVHGLWRQAPGHKEQNLMIKFLANDFELERWKLAATKNAYALLSKQRYEYAAAFFMLAGDPKDAINVVLRQMDDWQLAYALARVVEPDAGGPLAKWILSDTVLPKAFEGGHRWLATWAFWQLGRRDLAVKILISPMVDVMEDWSPEKSLPVGNPENDDPSLLLMFQQLKNKTLQTAKGTSEIPGKMEFDFVLHNARVFCRMGCHPLAIDLLHSWSFDRPFFPPPKLRHRPSSSASSPVDSARSPSRPVRPSLDNLSPSFSRGRRPSFMLAQHGRRESMVMDMDVLAESEAPTRANSPPSRRLNGVFEDDDEDSEREKPSMPLTSHINGTVEAVSELKGEKEKEKEEEVVPKKMGNLMKELKQDVQQGAMEFNMDNFF